MTSGQYGAHRISYCSRFGNPVLYPRHNIAIRSYSPSKAIFDSAAEIEKDDPYCMHGLSPVQGSDVCLHHVGVPSTLFNVTLKTL